MDQLSETAVNAVADLAKSAGATVLTVSAPSNAKGIPTSVPALLDPKTGNATSLKQLFDAWRDTPDRKSGTARITTLESFIDLTRRHATENSAIFAATDWKAPFLLTVVDYHHKNTDVASTEGEVIGTEVGKPENGKHRIEYKFPLSEEWQAWVKMDKQPLNQQAFAEFIEDHIGELASPHEEEVTFWQDKLGGKVAYPHELKMLSIGLKVHAETRVSNNVTLQTGEGELTWEETHRDMKGDKLIVPSLFIIQLPPFFMGEAIRLPVRLRYRVREGSVVWIFQMYRPDVYVTEQVMRDMERAARETDLPAYQGTPEMSA
ncbi:DUF2303 family protein [Neorhizobium sp. JUb45]|uniref:DUF2303 family protein n=1 Tax=Neorhizobium sp. JUb45 TaxID=2485113 RepID=UPI001043E7C6|nr:DUF2303 family protein [Neorhizobium sp. JUb45]TCR01091.1 uncharacterized protein DUF2303 [Neorhizobium sp. JUb45]